MDVDVHTYNVEKNILEDYDVVDVSAQTDKIMKNCLFVVRENYEFKDLPDVIKENYKRIDKVNCYYIYVPSNK